MKVGMIFECGKEGADVKVCRHLVRMLDPDIELIPIGLDNKPKLLNGCGKVALQLLRDGCERVVIVWDLYPAWREKKGRPCRKADRDTIYSSLRDAGVTSTEVYLVCIREELEAWLLADERALKAFLHRPTHSPRVQSVRKPEATRNPKGTLTRLLSEHNVKYVDYIHAERIVANLPDLNRLAKCETFRRFALKVAQKVV